MVMGGLTRIAASLDGFLKYSHVHKRAIFFPRDEQIPNSY